MENKMGNNHDTATRDEIRANRPKRRAYKRDYERLYDDPTALTGDCNVLLWPNGYPEIWVQSRDGKRGMTIKIGDGPAGLGVTVTAQSFRPAMTTSGNLAGDYAVYPPKGEPPVRFADVTLVQLRPDCWAQAFGEWYGGRGEHPGERPGPMCSCGHFLADHMPQPEPDDHNPTYCVGAGNCGCDHFTDASELDS